MATVKMNSVFPPGTEVSLVKRRAEAQHVSGGIVAKETVGKDSVLEIDNLTPGDYWAVTDKHGTVQVRAKGDNDKSTRPEPTETIDGPVNEQIVVSPPPATEALIDADTGERKIARQDRGTVMEDELTGNDPGNDDEDSDDDVAVSPQPAREVVSGARTTATARRPRSPRSSR